MLRHALDVLVDNALRHGAGTASINHAVSEEVVTLTITDEGPGFAGNEAASQLQPLAIDGAPHGLGLPLAQRLIAAMPARLTITHAGPSPRIDIVLQRSVPAAH